MVFASESCALDAVGASFERDLDPGEILVVEDGRVRTVQQPVGDKGRLCIFEYIYFARPDSVICGQSVHEARRRAGRLLAREHAVEADVVIGVPDSGLDAAMGYAQESGIPYGVGLVKTRYIGRTFITPGQDHREQAVRIKLGALKSCVEGRRVVLVDDSIVRGTTSRQIVALLREAGASEIHLRSSAPPLYLPLLVRYRHPQQGGAHRLPLLHRKNSSADRRGQLGLFEPGRPEAHCPGRRLRLLRRLLHRELPLGPVTPRPRLEVRRNRKAPWLRREPRGRKGPSGPGRGTGSCDGSDFLRCPTNL